MSPYRCCAIFLIAICACATNGMAEEQRPAQAAEAKKEGLDALPAGTKGVSEGTIVSKEKSKLIVHTKDGDLLFMPHWRGGMPKDGGGLDQAMVATLEGYAVGDSVRIEWIWEERRRIEAISKTK